MFSGNKIFTTNQTVESAKSDMPTARKTVSRKKSTRSTRTKKVTAKRKPRATTKKSTRKVRRIPVVRRSRVIVPCVDDTGREMPWMARGMDGTCRTRSCGPQSVLDPSTNRCVSTSTPHGRNLAAAKKRDDALRFVQAYDTQLAEKGMDPAFQARYNEYYNKFGHDATEYLRKRLIDRQNDIKTRVLMRQKYQDERLQDARVPDAGFFYHKLNRTLAQ